LLLPRLSHLLPLLVVLLVIGVIGVPAQSSVELVSKRVLEPYYNNPKMEDPLVHQILMKCKDVQVQVRRVTSEEEDQGEVKTIGCMILHLPHPLPHPQYSCHNFHHLILLLTCQA
jgi:hypothetical protein